MSPLRLFLACISFPTLFVVSGCTNADKSTSDALVGTWKSDTGDIDVYSPDGTSTTLEPVINFGRCKLGR